MINKRYIIKETNLNDYQRDSYKLLEFVQSSPSIQLFDRAWILFKDQDKFFVAREINGFLKIEGGLDVQIIDKSFKDIVKESINDDIDKFNFTDGALLHEKNENFSINWI